MTSRGWWMRQKAKPGGALAEVWRQRHHAASALRSARAEAADDGMFAMRESRLAMAQVTLRKCQERFDRADAAWRSAGCPNERGTRTTPPERKP